MAILDFIKQYGERAARDASALGAGYMERTEEQIRPAVEAARLSPRAFPGTYRPTAQGRAAIAAQDTIQSTATPPLPTYNNISQPTSIAPNLRAEGLSRMSTGESPRQFTNRLGGTSPALFATQNMAGTIGSATDLRGFRELGTQRGRGILDRLIQRQDERLTVERANAPLQGEPRYRNETDAIQNILGFVPVDYETNPRTRRYILRALPEIMRAREAADIQRADVELKRSNYESEAEYRRALAEQAQGAGALSRAQAEQTRFAISPEGQRQAIDVQRAKQRDDTEKQTMEFYKNLAGTQQKYFDVLSKDPMTIQDVRNRLAQRRGLNTEDISITDVLNELDKFARQQALNAMGSGGIPTNTTR